jgi:hypothetical protein
VEGEAERGSEGDANNNKDQRFMNSRYHSRAGVPRSAAHPRADAVVLRDRTGVRKTGKEIGGKGRKRRKRRLAFHLSTLRAMPSRTRRRVPAKVGCVPIPASDLSFTEPQLLRSAVDSLSTWPQYRFIHLPREGCLVSGTPQKTSKTKLCKNNNSLTKGCSLCTPFITLPCDGESSLASQYLRQRVSPTHAALIS